MDENKLADKQFDIKTHVDWVNQSSVRTRAVSVVLVIATVLVGIGFYNSLKWSWARDRIKRIYNPGDRTIFSLMDSEINPKFRSDSFFVGNDFIEANFNSFSSKLVNKTDLLSTYIYEHLNESTQRQLAEYLESRQADPKTTPSVRLLSTMALEFNELLKDRNLYSSERFEKIKLRPETKGFLEYNPGGRDLIRFNRLLLEDYFPDEISRSSNLLPENEYRREMQRALVSGYIENIRYIKIPFFGVAFDVNDLGVIGGLGLHIILLMFRFSLSREIKNLRYAFKKAHRNGELEEFYHALAMNQVLIVPEMKNLRRNPRLAVSFMIVPLMTGLIYTAGVFYDWWSVLKQGLYKYNEASFTLWVELFWLPLIWILSIICAERIMHINKLWGVYWRVIVREKVKKIRKPFPRKFIRKLRRILLVIKIKKVNPVVESYVSENKPPKKQEKIKYSYREVRKRITKSKRKPEVQGKNPLTRDS